MYGRSDINIFAKTHGSGNVTAKAARATLWLPSASAVRGDDHPPGGNG